MTIESVKKFFETVDLNLEIIELQVSTATVALAAQAFNVEPGRIAKSLAFRLSDSSVIILVASGDVRIDNQKFRQVFGKGKMLAPEEVAHLTGHPVGGVCPFGLAQPLPIFLDQSLLKFDELLPAAGSVNSAVRISPQIMAEVTRGQWVDVCSVPIIARS